MSDESGPLYGIIDQPYIGERFEGGFARGLMRGARGTKNLSTRTTTRLEDSLLCTTYPEIGTKRERDAFERVASRVSLTRYGLDCYSCGLLAIGLVDLIIEAGLKPYDAHAPIAVVSSAGGIVSDWKGNPAHDGGTILVSANEKLHQVALETLEFNQN